VLGRFFAHVKQKVEEEHRLVRLSQELSSQLLNFFALNLEQVERVLRPKLNSVMYEIRTLLWKLNPNVGFLLFF
jgi:hypothetical protein